MNVGDYVRTNKGEIGKVTSIAKDNLGFGNMEFCNTEPFVYGDIIKSSPWIIDLIEVGDYVNGNKIVHIQEEEFPNYPKRLLFAGVDENNIDDVWEVYNNEDIKSIVTHEQMKAMQYRVEE